MTIIQQLRHVADQLAAIDDPVAFTLAEVCRGRALILQHAAVEYCPACGGDRSQSPHLYPCDSIGSHPPTLFRLCARRADADRVTCVTCDMAWDINDPDPPKCPL